MALVGEVTDARAALDAATIREDALVSRLTAAEAHDVDMCAELAAAEDTRRRLSQTWRS